MTRRCRLRKTTLHLSHIFLTRARTFIAIIIFSSIEKEGKTLFQNLLKLTIETVSHLYKWCKPSDHFFKNKRRKSSSFIKDDE